MTEPWLHMVKYISANQQYTPPGTSWRSDKATIICSVPQTPSSPQLSMMLFAHVSPRHGMSTVQTNNLGLSRRIVRQTAQTLDPWHQLGPSWFDDHGWRWLLNKHPPDFSIGNIYYIYTSAFGVHFFRLPFC